MTSEIIIPGLPCRDLNDILPFYTALGFEMTYLQQRPNPYTQLRRGGIELHFFGVDGFNPEHSMGSVVIAVPDVEDLHTQFAAGLRAAFGKVPASGIPRMTRPRRKQGMVGGFAVVDPGGNWLRISRIGDTEDKPPKDRLARAVNTAARQADSHGDEQAGILVLENALARHTSAPTVQKVSALVYLTELRQRVGDRDGAAKALAEVDAMELSDEERRKVARDLATADELRQT
nr:VOC family protein [Kibdelosporangium sp. MJ126-NF4]CEL14452.1 hypothetical protein [Kibdelosporangium sp. MJ126-NF4]CTQ88817.1 hypothetical protein [Kibdelosporangium sp. MJ126-NF4]